MLRDPERVASPLIHPFGLPLLREYQALKGEDDSEEKDKSLSELASKLTAGLMEKKRPPKMKKKKKKKKKKVENKEEDKEEIWMLSEPTITMKIREVLHKNSSDATHTSERSDATCSGFEQSGCSPARNTQQGDPDIVERYVDFQPSHAISCFLTEIKNLAQPNKSKTKKGAGKATDETETGRGGMTLALCHKKREKEMAVMITEASVDNNGGKKKLAQAYEYARMQKDCLSSNQVLMIAWLHFDRKFRSGRGKPSELFESLTVMQESWLFVGDKEGKKKACVGLLWREVYQTKKWADVQKTINQSFMAYARSLACSRRLYELLKEAGGEWKKSDDDDRRLTLHEDEEQDKKAPSLTWSVVSDNVAIQNDNVVYKIFDNRQHQTWRKVDMWLTSPDAAPWLEPFNVRQEVVFEESNNRFRYLGYPLDRNQSFVFESHGFGSISLNKTDSTKLASMDSEDTLDEGAAVARDDGLNEDDADIRESGGTVKKRCKRRSNDSQNEYGSSQKKRSRLEDPLPLLSYPLGSVCVIAYEYLNGTHVASKLSHFLCIAKQIQQMHDAGYVHGDIRNWNMVHPWPKRDKFGKPIPQPEGGIEESRLLDFDFSGKEGECRYPPGFAEKLEDNAWTRCAKPGQLIQKKDDWRELASAMAKYRVFETPDVRARAVRANMELDFLAETFISEFENLAIALQSGKPAVEDIKEFQEKWGDCTIVLPQKEMETWQEVNISKGTDSPNKAMRAVKTTRNSVDNRSAE